MAGIFKNVVTDALNECAPIKKFTAKKNRKNRLSEMINFIDSLRRMVSGKPEKGKEKISLKQNFYVAKCLVLITGERLSKRERTIYRKVPIFHCLNELIC